MEWAYSIDPLPTHGLRLLAFGQGGRGGKKSEPVFHFDSVDQGHY
jgi:hypothetical protein